MDARPLLRWAGSKRLIIPKLKAYWNDDYKRYLEPFAGSAQLFFSIDPKRAILSDTNADLVNTYRTIQESPLKVYRKLENLPKGKKNYYAIRSLDKAKMGIIEQAARFIYLNRFCFNGLYRTNNAGVFNVPYSGYKTGDIPSWESFSESALKLSKAKFVCSDFEKVLANNLREGDFVYLDPPYAVSNRRIFKQYNAQTFGLADLQRLSELTHHIDAIGANFVVSYAYCSEALNLFRDWNIQVISTQRYISGFGKFRKRAKELLVSNIELE
jgi:DNA adenine methylase